jgi:hypothetical protein
MIIRSCPRCQANRLQLHQSFIETRPLPIWFHQYAVMAMAIAFGLMGAGVAIVNSSSPGTPLLPPYLPWLFIGLAGIGGGIWYKLRLRYGYMLYRVQCQNCGHQWAVEERG